MHDGIQLERRGVVAGVVITTAFVGAARAMATLDGLPDYPFVTVAHPSAELRGPALHDAAASVAAALEAIVVDRVS